MSVHHNKLPKTFKLKCPHLACFLNLVRIVSLFPALLKDLGSRIPHAFFFISKKTQKD